MRIIIAGGTGFIGAALSKFLLADGHQVWILTRNQKVLRNTEGAQMVGWDGRTIVGWGGLVSQVDAIVNLTGESIGSGPWTRSRKNRILSSRLEAGKAISDAIYRANPRPRVLIQASAVGFYGSYGDMAVTEETPPGHGFLAGVCKAWEESTQSVEKIGVRRIVIRTGVVLSPIEGALKRLMLPFKFFVGGKLGNGKQGFPWIHPIDEVAAILYLLESPNGRGVFNLSAPVPLSNNEFGHILAKAMGRPYWLPVPAMILRLALGEMSALILEGQYMIPKRLQELGFHFKFENADDALRDLLKG